MPIQINDKGLYTGVDAMLRTLLGGVEDGLQSGARVPEGMMQSSPAHGDQTGATHASYDVALIGGTHTGASEAAEAYSEAQQAIARAIVSHGGKALSEDSGIVLGPTERGLIYRSFTDYQHELEQSPKAVIGPTLQQTARLMTEFAANGSKDALR
jgi:hypothetical protein